MNKSLAALMIASAICGGAPIARADFIEVDISSYLNGNVLLGAITDPVGLSYGNANTGIPFETYAYGANGYMGSAFLAGTSSPGTSSALTINLSSYDITGESSFYALLNNYYGTLGQDEYNVVLTFSGGGSVTYESIGGVDTRDYNQNTVNTISDTTTTWFNNGQGQRLDVREFLIPTQYQSSQLLSIAIDQLDSNDPAFLSGLTFSTGVPASFVSEPSSFALFGVGVLSVCLVQFQRRRGAKQGQSATRMNCRATA
jgi:hypothetical protein